MKKIKAERTTCAIFQLADRVLRTDNSVKLQAENIAPSVMCNGKDIGVTRN